MDYTNDFLEKAANIVDAALALKKSMEQHGYAFHNGSFERVPEDDTHQYCYCHTVPEEILPHVDHSLGFSRGKLYEFRGIDEEGDYHVIGDLDDNETDCFFSPEEFHMCFRMATQKECEQAESGKSNNSPLIISSTNPEKTTKTRKAFDIHSGKNRYNVKWQIKTEIR